MEDIIYKIDNWTIVKILGGVAVVLTAILTFFSNYFLTKFRQREQHNLNKKIENLKGELSKQQSTYSSIIDNYFNNSDR
ncbi:hypothetical protein NBRC110019_13170 [Neptunitalea chrysea]|uniref:Uncharacterized protein n=1 Tax=Neptunitalea chrysea TaxID=1647581 RepID=A0A9W6B440_9FLAO|nr:hypothetical protein [Neptunitalea chrysea]GLB52278.1 hypothetical protein NBRC110019_13170 [Neptunitalea chrysea]